MDEKFQSIVSRILGELKQSDEPLGLEDIFDEVSEDHKRAAKYLAQETESIERTVSQKYQLR